MPVLPPGTLLQLIYLRERLARLPAGRFIEVGPGSGEVTELLLQMGWQGMSLDLNASTIESLKHRFQSQIDEGRFVALTQDFNKMDISEPKAGLVISCMVMEHMEDDQEALFVEQAAKCLAPGGMMIGLVPGSPEHWGIEDDIAGHIRRYSRQRLNLLMEKNNWRIRHCAGLTVPLSNMLLPISNLLVRRAERSRLKLSKLERTKLSGKRKVAFKTHFPSILGLLLNRFTLLPFHYLQKSLAGSSRALVIYFEAQPQPGKTRS